MATDPKVIVPDTKGGDQPARKPRKPMSKAQKAKLAAALKRWRDSQTDEDRQATNERIRQAHKERWDNMSERERRDRLAGVKAWQKEQRVAKRAVEKAAKSAAKTAPNAGAKAKTAKAVAPAEAGPSPAAKAGAAGATAKRSRKAVAK